MICACDECVVCAVLGHMRRAHTKLSFGTASGEITTEGEGLVCAKRDKGRNREGPRAKNGTDRMESPLGGFVKAGEGTRSSRPP